MPERFGEDESRPICFDAWSPNYMFTFLFYISTISSFLDVFSLLEKVHICHLYVTLKDLILNSLAIPFFLAQGVNNSFRDKKKKPCPLLALLLAPKGGCNSLV